MVLQKHYKQGTNMIAKACKYLSYASILGLSVALSSTAFAKIIPGCGFTTDTAQRLDFLWPAASLNCSVNEVLGVSGSCALPAGRWTKLATGAQLTKLVRHMGINDRLGSNKPFSLAGITTYQKIWGHFIKMEVHQ